MARTKKQPELEGDLVIVISADEDQAEAIEDALTSFLDDHEGLNVQFTVIGVESEDEEEESEDEEEDEEEEDESEEDEEEEEGYTEEDLTAMSVAELKEVCEEFYIEPPKGKANIVAAILEAQEEGDEEDEDEEEEEDEEEGDEEVIDEDALNAMSLAELKALAEEMEVEVPARTKKDALIELILEEASEE